MKRVAFWVVMLALNASALVPMGEVLFHVRVLDEEGAPITNATVRTGFYTAEDRADGAGETVHETRVEVTDTNGLCSFSGRCYGRAGFGVSAGGYYDHGMSLAFSKDMAGNLEPRGCVYEVRLRELVDPVSMYARRLVNVSLPAYNVPVGYDMVKGDWVSPYGVGERPDFILQLDCEFGEGLPDGGQSFDASFTIRFSNESDGIQEIREQLRGGSLFHLPRYAPLDGYTNKWVHGAYEHKGVYSNTQREDQSFIFRVRTETSQDGRITNALYGKIRGPVTYEVRRQGARVCMKYYLNPTPNDRNLEFDPKKNLFKDLKPMEQVWEP